MKVENLSKTYRTKGAPPVQALRGVSFTLPDTGMVFLLGRSGSGKSTLLHILSGLESFDAGDITYRGNRFADFSERDRDKYRNSCCGIIFQDYSLITELTVGETLRLRSVYRASATPTRASDTPLIRWGFRAANTAASRSFRAGRSSASRLRGRSSSPRAFYLPMSRRAHSTNRRARTS